MKAWLVLAAATLVAALVFPPLAWILGFFLVLRPAAWVLDTLTKNNLQKWDQPKG